MKKYFIAIFLLITMAAIAAQITPNQLAPGIPATKISAGDVDDTEFDYLNGVTSAIQTQIDTKITASSTDTLTNKTINTSDNTITIVEADISDLSHTTDTNLTDEAVEDIIGAIVADTAELDFSYSDATPSISAVIVAGSIDETKLDTSTNASLDLADSAVQDATTDTLTNKTINTASNTITVVEADISDLSHTTDTNLTEEEVEDFAGGMLGGTETGITVTYQDSTNDIDFVVDVTESSTNTLTNKTLNTASNTITVVEADISDLAHTTNTNADTICTGTGNYLDGEGNCDALITNATHSGDVTGSGALTIADEAVTLAKMAHMATDSFLGRDTASTGDVEVLSVGTVQTLLNVEDGSTADQSDAEIKTAYENNADTNEFDDTEQSKLAAIEALADVTDTANVTSAGALMDSEVDADIKTLSLPANATISTFGESVIDDANAAAARTTLDVDQAGTDNSTDVTVSGTPNYITLSGQDIVRGTVDIGDDTNLAAGTGITLTGDSLSTDDANIDHDSLSNFVANEHINHTSVTLTAGDGLSGGGDISSNRTFTVDLNELGNETAIAAGDFIPMVDITDSGSQKITFANLEGDLDALNLLNAPAEANADVTDTANVTSAGALMDSEVDADIKTLTLPASTDITAAAATVLDDASVADMVDTLGGATSTGTGGIARATSPTLVTPTLGVATATSIGFGDEALDTYDQGSWTPTFTATGTDPSVTYGTQAGRYIRVGDIVTVWGRLVMSSIGGSPTGIPQVASLPFTVRNSVENRASLIINNGLSTGMDVSGITNAGGRGGYALGNSTVARLYVLRTDATSTAFTFSEIAASTTIYFSITYEVN